MLVAGPLRDHELPQPPHGGRFVGPSMTQDKQEFYRNDKNDTTFLRSYERHYHVVQLCCSIRVVFRSKSEATFGSRQSNPFAAHIGRNLYLGIYNYILFLISKFGNICPK